MFIGAVHRMAAALDRHRGAHGECFGLASTYSAYPLFAEARARVIRGELDAIRLVQVRYLQGWLNAEIDADAAAATKWTAIDPGRAGAGPE